MKIIELNIKDNGRVKLTGYIQEPSREMATVAKKPAVLIFPGGGYMFLSDREAEPIALKYAAEGFQAFILNYSINEYVAGFAPLSEASEAIRIIREHADEWYVEPEHIAICGFSAGGHLACAVGLLGEHRPNALILSYPAIDVAAPEEDWEKHFAGNITQKAGITQDELKMLSLHNQVTDDTPPAFIWHTFEDGLVKINHTVKLINAYMEHKVPFEYHVFQKGAHGLSLAEPIVANGNKEMVDFHASRWFDMSVEWLRIVFGPVPIKA